MKMYSELASWWPLISAPEDYAEEAGQYASAIEAASDGRCRTVLELGSGGGNNASHMKQRFELTLVEPSDGMLAVSRALNQHLRPGGVALVAPDYVAETFRPGTDCGGHDGVTRSARYLEWVWDPDPSDTSYIADYTFTLRESDGSVRVELDRHIEGLFPRTSWLNWLEQTGFRASQVVIEHSEAGRLELFAGRRLSWGSSQPGRAS